MKRITRAFVLETTSIYLASIIASGMAFDEGIKTILIAGAVLAVVSFTIKPIISMLLLPLNLLTFGFFRWITNVITLYIVTLVVAGFSITSFVFSGLGLPWFTIPEIALSGFLAYIGFSFLISVFNSVVYWLIR